MNSAPSAIARASTNPIPIIELFGQLLVPLQGDISDVQMDELCDRVLDRLRRSDVEGLVIDASGVWMVDSHLCAAVGKLASSARLMGARSVLCGLGPDVVLTLQEMGFHLRGIQAALGMEAALRLLGVIGVREERAPADEDSLFDEGGRA